ncbi:deoxyribose-phosphate aldolase [Halyomorpha halys]|uniref:deoxyribose-phosphate aldolase n=1 Tax=Halyomorpha halys TaxID=286706 RepID=UPI0006D51CDD|nr:deoxyribose-phosphate aldolase [Halyomorpha halys]
MYLEFDPTFCNGNVHVNEPSLHKSVSSLCLPVLHKNYEAAWLLKTVSCIDLTTLASDDTFSNVSRLCMKAVHPISKPILCSFAENREEFEFLKKISVAAVCVYPSRVADAVKQLKLLDSPLPVASVATGFPSGQYPLTTRVDEVSFCVENGASEVDIVIDRSLVLSGRWSELHQEVHKMKEACGDAHLKAILAVGECGSPDNIYKASMACMMAGADFIKTSTGKEVINANLPAGLVMCRAIRDFYRKTNTKVGLKPAGGVRTWSDAFPWLELVKKELGKEWLDPQLFRIGASGLLQDLERRLYRLANGVSAPSTFFKQI